MHWKLLIVFALTMTHVNAKYASPCITTDQQPGVCMPVKSCKPVYNFFIRISENGGVITEQDKTNLSSMFCGRYKNVPLVCCPQTEIQLNAEGLNILKRSRCGIYHVDRIARGFIAPLFQYPWMALIIYEDDINPFKCAGSLISDRYVLTAAHCIKDKEDLIKAVRLGEYQISTQFDCTNFTRKNQCAPPVEDVEIEEFIIHEDYETVYNDIALLRLKREVKFQLHIQPVCLPIYDDLRSKIYDSYIIAGWGRTENGSTSDILLTAFVPFVNVTDCENKLRKYRLRNSLNLGHLCAGGSDLVDACPGDSGGPLGYRDYYDGKVRFVQFGVVSMGVKKCGFVNVPGIYSNTSHHIQWITDNLKASSSIEHKITTRFVKEESCNTPALESGLCVPYKECPFVNELSQNYGSYEAIPKFYLKYIYRSKCSKENEPVRLCCKMPNNYVRPTPPTASQNDPILTEDLDYTRDISSQFNPEGIQILKQLKCGIDDGDRIAGGNETELAEFPWMALLRYDDAPGQEFKCGGALITNRYVLTATHCINDPVYSVIGVRLGEHNLDTNPDCKLKLNKNVCMPPVEDFGVEKIIIHPRYSKKRRVNDIGLIKLDRPVQFKKHIKPICLPITRPSYEAIPNKFTIAGWGATEIKYSTKSNVLLKAEISRENNAVCQNRYASFRLEITQKHICAADLKTGRDSCRGDSGGPLFSFNDHSEEKNSKNYVQYGIVAAGGVGCKLDQKFPGLYTNVITFLPWITNNIIY